MNRRQDVDAEGVWLGGATVGCRWLGGGWLKGSSRPGLWAA